MKVFRRLFVALLLILAITILMPDQTVLAVKRIPDGEALYSNGYRAADSRDVNKTVREMWDNGKREVSPTAKKGSITFVRGGKNPTFYDEWAGNMLIYDVYAGSTNQSKKREWSVIESGGEPYFSFDGWAIIKGHHHHDKQNQATYIGLVNRDNPREKHIFKARMLTNTSANPDIHDDALKRCPNDAFNRKADKSYGSSCNMDYKYTQFRAYIPLNDVFGNDEDVNKVWNMYIIKRVEDRIVYDELVLPYDSKVYNWPNRGKITMESGQDNDKLRSVGVDVVKRKSARGGGGGWGSLGYFVPGQIYNRTGFNESSGVANWYRVYDNKRGTGQFNTPNHVPSYENRWASSVFWDFVGSVATLTWKKTHVDVTVHHKDARTNTVVKTERLKAPYKSSNNYTLRPKQKGELKDDKGNEILSEGKFSYVADPSRSSQTVTKSNIDGNFTVTFTYQPYVDVVINHIDANTNEVLSTETSKQQYGDSYKVNPKGRGYFKDEFDYPYISISKGVSYNNLKGVEKRLSGNRVAREQVINFYYKPVLPDPSREVEVGGGKNTHGHAKGKAFWELRKNNVNEESKVYADNNFTITGTHYATRNPIHTLGLGGDYHTSSDPISLISKADDYKNEDMEYDFEYEYTNHFKVSYVCAESIGNDCVEWEQDKIEPAWDKPYGKKFKLAETEGDFTHYSTSRLARINSENVIIFADPNDKSGVNAGNLHGYTYFVKEKAVKGNDVFYLLSNNSSNTDAIGWVREQDLTSYTNFSMDKRSKIIRLTGEGSSYSRAWGWSKQKIHDLSEYRGEEFHVNLTETVGDNIWYRGKINGHGSNVWVHQNYTDSYEIIAIKPITEKVIKKGQHSDILKLKMDHRHGETIKENTIDEIISGDGFLVGRSDTFTIDERLVEEFHERFEKLSNLMKNKLELKTQSAFNVKPDSMKYFVKVPSERHKNDNFIVLQKGYIYGHYFPVDVDDSLKEDLMNYTEYEDYGDYAFFLQQNKMKDKGIKGDERVYEFDFVTDYFFTSERTGFLVTYPYAYQLNRHLMWNDTKPTEQLVIELTQSKFNSEYFKQTDYDFRENIVGIDGNTLTDEGKLQRYFIPISPTSELEPNEVYTNTIVLKNVGLNDITWEFGQAFSFEHYLYGSGHDNAWFIEQADSKIGDFTEDDVETIVIRNEDLDEIAKTVDERPRSKLHLFRVTDLDFIDKIRGYLEGF